VLRKPWWRSSHVWPAPTIERPRGYVSPCIPTSLLLFSIPLCSSRLCRGSLKSYSPRKRSTTSCVPGFTLQNGARALSVGWSKKRDGEASKPPLRTDKAPGRAGEEEPGGCVGFGCFQASFAPTPSREGATGKTTKNGIYWKYFCWRLCCLLLQFLKAHGWKLEEAADA